MNYLGLRKTYMASYKSIIVFFILLLAGNVSYAEVYRHVDENGKVYYSDKPKEGSEKIELENTYMEKDAKLRQQQTNENKKLVDDFKSDLQIQSSEDDRDRARSESEQKNNATRQKRECASARADLHNAKENLKDKKYQGVRVKEENRLQLKINEYERKVDEKC